MNYSKEAQELAYAWESTKTPLEAIAEAHIRLGEQILILGNLTDIYEKEEDK